MSTKLIDILWVLTSMMLVVFMQVGFLFIESGLTRAKNSINVAIKNMCDFSISGMVYWVFGFGIMFGTSFLGLAGKDHYFMDLADTEFQQVVFFLYQLAFCSTAITIVSGAVAERMYFFAYLVNSFLMALLVYPIVGHWAWGGGFLENAGQGWLASLGFVDFAGSIVVHATGGSVALAILMIIGPRTGKYPEDNSPPKIINGSNVPLAVAGGIILWIGWIGFNGGSTFAFNKTVPAILANTILAAVSGLLSALFSFWKHKGYTSASAPLNGSLGGLVAITACCHVVSTPEAVFIGAVAGLLVILSSEALEKLKIDDAVGAIPVHTVSGLWGALCVGLFGDLEAIGTGLDRWEQIGVQALGSFAICAFAFLIIYILLSIFNLFKPIRISLEDEFSGLNVTEHRASTELIALFRIMDHQYQTGNLREKVPVEPFTEVGQIAERYNMVTSKVRSMLTEKEKTHSVLRKYTPIEILNDIQNGKNPLERKFEKTEKIILFSDIYNSTTLSEALSLERFSDILNAYYKISNGPIIAHGGTISKLTGDGLLAYFTAENGENAVKACLEILDKLKQYRDEANDLGQYLYAGFGLSLGTVFVGNIGSELHKDYTLIGDTVNTGARLESLTRSLKSALVMDVNIAKQIKDTMKIKKLGMYQPKGKQAKVEIYTIDEPQVYTEEVGSVLKEQLKQAIANNI